jgi:hypothetical protein
MDATKVGDGESLYRAIRANSNEYVIADGVLRFSSTSFNDTHRKPSVDRSSLRPDPRDARIAKSDGVVKLLAKD